MIVNSERLNPSALASSLTTASFAAPSVGALATRTSSSPRPPGPVRQLPIPGLAERGVTRIAKLLITPSPHAAPARADLSAAAHQQQQRKDGEGHDHHQL